MEVSKINYPLYWLSKFDKRAVTSQMKVKPDILSVGGPVRVFGLLDFGPFLKRIFGFFNEKERIIGLGHFINGS